MPIAPEDIEPTFQTATQLQQSGQLPQAEALCLEIISAKPAHFNALNLLALIAVQLFKYDESLRYFERAIASNDSHAPLYNNYGIVLDRIGRLQEAIGAYDKAIALQPEYPQALNNRGYALFKLRDYKNAIRSYQSAIRIRPGFAEAHLNLGSALNRLNLLEAARASYAQAYALAPNNQMVLGALSHTKMRMCDWSDFDQTVEKISNGIANGTVAVSPFSLLALTDTPALHRRAAETWTAQNCPENPALGPIPKRAPSDKIKVGYFSMDFREHPVAQLAVELFEHHDKAGFEVTAFSFSEDTGDDMQARLKRAFPQFLDVRDKSEREIAALARTLGIDIAVDLAGHTIHSRAGLFAYRAAPIQVSYLGFPGTFGAPYMDYVLADRVVIPENQYANYGEKIAVLPHSYQANAAWFDITAVAPSRRDLNLPETAFVFCCFNNNHKITPPVFAAWMRILQGAAGSVLWLLADNDIAARNLRAEAEKRGVAADRLIFAPRATRLDHLARQQAADLFLDTLPYNAHTTASDALRYGLPILTCQGEAFAGRVAASLLTTLHLPELITSSLAAYERRAIELATTPTLMATLRQQLRQTAPTSPLFNPALFARHVEDLYRQMVARSEAGVSPDHLALDQLSTRLSSVPGA